MKVEKRGYVHKTCAFEIIKIKKIYNLFSFNYDTFTENLVSFLDFFEI